MRYSSHFFRPEETGEIHRHLTGRGFAFVRVAPPTPPASSRLCQLLTGETHRAPEKGRIHDARLPFERRASGIHVPSLDVIIWEGVRPDTAPGSTPPFNAPLLRVVSEALYATNKDSAWSLESTMALVDVLPNTDLKIPLDPTADIGAVLMTDRVNTPNIQFTVLKEKIRMLSETEAWNGYFGIGAGEAFIYNPKETAVIPMPNRGRPNTFGRFGYVVMTAKLIDAKVCRLPDHSNDFEPAVPL